MSTAGSIKRDASGQWAFVVDIPGPEGKRRQLRRRGFATKKAAQDELTRLLGDAQRGVFDAPTKVTLGEFLTKEWLPAKRPSLRESTAASYEQLVRLYVIPKLGGVRLQLIDGSALNRLYADLLESGRNEHRRKNVGAGLAPKTVRNLHGVLTKAFRDAIRWGRLQRNPCDAADPPKGKSPEMKAWSGDQLRTFSRSVATHRWSGIWSLMATTGMRRGEVLGLRWSDVDLEAATVTIRSTRVRFGTTITTSTPKTAKGNRTIALGPTVLAGLKAWRSTQNADRLLMGAGWMNTADLVVTIADGSAPNPEAFSNVFGDLAKAAELPIIRLHDVRHSYATAALAAGVPVKVVSQRLGHADVGVTLKIYAHVMPGDDEDAASRAESLIISG
jgi:integrase